MFFKKFFNKIMNNSSQIPLDINDGNIEDLRGKEAPRHIDYYNNIYRLKTDPNSFIDLEKVTHSNVVYGEDAYEYDLHFINLANKQKFIVKNTELMQKLNVTRKPSTNFGDVVGKDGFSTSQTISQFGAAFTSYGNNANKGNPLLGPALLTPSLPMQTGGFIDDKPMPDIVLTDAQVLGYDRQVTPQHTKFKHRHTFERIKKETEVVSLKFDNMPNKAFIKMFVENLDMDKNELKEFNNELANYVFEANRTSIMDSIKKYYYMGVKEKTKRGRPQGVKNQKKKKELKVEEIKENNEVIDVNLEEAWEQ